jgi:hypothetical protein
VPIGNEAEGGADDRLIHPHRKTAFSEFDKVLEKLKYPQVFHLPTDKPICVSDLPHSIIPGGDAAKLQAFKFVHWRILCRLPTC